MADDGRLELELDEALGPAGPDERWTVLYTRSRREKQVACACEKLGIRYYLPLREHRTHAGGRIRIYQLPVFPSYLFSCLGWLGRRAILDTHAVVRMIPVRDPGTLLHELAQLRLALASGVELTAGPALTAGVRVRVVRGPLEGVEGHVLSLRERRRCERLVLNVTMLGRSVTAELDRADVVPLNWPPREPSYAPSTGALAGVVAAA